MARGRGVADNRHDACWQTLSVRHSRTLTPVPQPGLRWVQKPLFAAAAAAAVAAAAAAAAAAAFAAVAAGASCLLLRLLLLLAASHLHEGHEQLDHLIVLLKVVPVSVQRAVSIKGYQPQRLSRRMDLERGRQQQQQQWQQQSASAGQHSQQRQMTIDSKEPAKQLTLYAVGRADNACMCP